MDKPEANPERIKEQLTKYELVPEEWGGETIICPISAKTGEGIDNLLEMVNLTAEMQELKANPNRSAHGAVIEARLDKGRGPVATLLVQNGTLKQGDVIIAGTAVGRVRAMTDAKGEKLTEAGPSVPVEIIGMGEVPDAGDDFHAVADERMARELAEQRKHEQKMASSAPVGKVSLEESVQPDPGRRDEESERHRQGRRAGLRRGRQGQPGEAVQRRGAGAGHPLRRGRHQRVRRHAGHHLQRHHRGLQRPADHNAKESAGRNKVDMRMYRVIYDCINEIETAMKGMLAPKFKEVDLGTAEVRNVFASPAWAWWPAATSPRARCSGAPRCACCATTSSSTTAPSPPSSASRDSVKEVAQGYECGITFEKFQDIKEGDIVEAYLMEQIEV